MDSEESSDERQEVPAETWEASLRRAWQAYCREMPADTGSAEAFSETALQIARKAPKGKADVFTQAPGSRGHSTEKPDDAETRHYYVQVVRAQQSSLKMLVRRAAECHSGGRAANFVMLAACFVYCLKRRLEAFFLRLAGTPPRWSLLRDYRFENCSRMLDETTWAFIGVYRSFASGRPTRNWENVLGWLIRNEFTCIPRAYEQGMMYLAATPEAKFNTSAYNHQCGHNKSMMEIMASLLPMAELCANYLRTIVYGKPAEAVAVAALLKPRLLETTGLGHFNVKEIMWHAILLREAFDWKQKRRGNGLGIRKQIFVESLYGTGGLRGLALFYPAVQEQTTTACAQDLQQYLCDEYSFHFHEAHDEQWSLCLFQKTLNTKYNRRLLNSQLKPACYFATWHQRFTEYPLGIGFFQELAGNVGLEDEFLEFAAQCSELHKLIKQGKLAGDNSCRLCWREAGVSLKRNSRQSHKQFACAGFDVKPVKRCRT